MRPGVIEPSTDGADAPVADGIVAGSPCQVRKPSSAKVYASFAADGRPYSSTVVTAVGAHRSRAAEAAWSARPLTGEVPDAAHPPTGCTFHPRCPLAEDVCRTTAPPLLPMDVDQGGDEHLVACHVVARSHGTTDDVAR